MADEKEVRCVKCGTLFGQIVIIEGIEFFQTETLLHRTDNAACRKCGEPFHHATSDKLMEKIVKRGGQTWVTEKR
jgi:transcription initiation factor TFIIIB Brf1 subunit/transcription initiation factor TFIIB